MADTQSKSAIKIGTIGSCPKLSSGLDKAIKKPLLREIKLPPLGLGIYKKLIIWWYIHTWLYTFKTLTYEHVMLYICIFRNKTNWKTILESLQL